MVNPSPARKKKAIAVAALRQTKQVFKKKKKNYSARPTPTEPSATREDFMPESAAFAQRITPSAEPRRGSIILRTQTPQAVHPLPAPSLVPPPRPTKTQLRSRLPFGCSQKHECKSHTDRIALCKTHQSTGWKFSPQTVAGLYTIPDRTQSQGLE